METEHTPHCENPVALSPPADSVTEVDNQLLTFHLDRQLYGVSIAHVEQIISMQPITEIPEFPSYAKGVVSLRGNIIPVIDLRLRLGKAETGYTERTCIVIITVGELQLGCIVDEVDAVVHVTEEQIVPPPRMAKESASNRYLTGIAKLPGENGAAEKIVLCLELSKLLLQDEFALLTGSAS